MGKYDPIFRYLNSNVNPKVILSNAEIENILSAKLPNSAYKYKELANNGTIIMNDYKLFLDKVYHTIKAL